MNKEVNKVLVAQEVTMIEIRWVWHNLEHGAPPPGSICIEDGRLYQKLQYRTMITVYDTSKSGIMPSMRREWMSWSDVPHSGVMHPNPTLTAPTEAQRIDTVR